MDDNKLLQESNLTAGSHAGRAISLYILFNTLLPPTKGGLVNLKGFSRVSIPYGMRNLVVSTNIPDVFHYSADPLRIIIVVIIIIIIILIILCYNYFFYYYYYYYYYAFLDKEREREIEPDVSSCSDFQF